MMIASGLTTGYHPYPTHLYALSYVINSFASTTIASILHSVLRPHGFLFLYISFPHAQFLSFKNNQSYDHTYKTAIQILDMGDFFCSNIINQEWVEPGVFVYSPLGLSIRFDTSNNTSIIISFNHDYILKSPAMFSSVFSIGQLLFQYHALSSSSHLILLLRLFTLLQSCPFLSQIPTL